MSNNVTETNPITAYGDLRTATLSPEVQISFAYTVDNTRITKNTIANGGTVTHSNAMAVVGTSTTTSSTALLQSVHAARYRAGLGGAVRMTTLFSTGVAGTYQLIGVMDETGSTAEFKNGIAIGYDGASFGLYRFINDTESNAPMSTWDDPLDGTGDSGMTIDTAKLNNWIISFEGAIRLYVEDDDTGAYLLVHTLNYANTETTPVTYIPNYKLTIWCNNGATTSDIVLKSSSMAYLIEGVNQFFDVQQPLFSSGRQTIAATGGAEGAIFTIKVKSTYNSITNFIDALLSMLTASVEASSTNNIANVRLVVNATLGGTPSYSDINTSDSIMSIDTAGTTVTGGLDLGSFPLAGKNDKINIKLQDLQIFLQPSDTLTVAVESANNADVYATILWKELF
jgi:hypothetical protein